MNKVVANTSPLIGLAAIKQLGVLKSLFGEVYIPNFVFEEVVQKGAGKPGSIEVKNVINDWIYIKSVKNEKEVELLLAVLDRGEAEAIVLAREVNAEIILLDNREPRIFAKKIGLNVLGTVGILLLAWKKGYIKNPLNCINDLRQKGFWLSDSLLEEVRQIIESFQNNID